MVWQRLMVFWFSKDNPTGHSGRKNEKRQTEEEVGEWSGMDFVSSIRAAENRIRWNGIVANSSVMLDDRPRLWERIEQNRE